MLKRVLPFCHALLKETVQPGDIVIDATIGNGNDTLLLSELVGPKGYVYGFDIQIQAIEKTKALLNLHQQPERQLICDSHANLIDYLSEAHHQQIKAAIFNLGYLPGGNKSIITTPDSTLAAVKIILSLLKEDGLLILVVYHGHSGGASERDALLHYVTGLEQKEYDVLRYGFINQRNSPPFIIAIQKKPRRSN